MDFKDDLQEEPFNTSYDCRLDGSALDRVSYCSTIPLYPLIGEMSQPKDRNQARTKVVSVRRAMELASQVMHGHYKQPQSAFAKHCVDPSHVTKFSMWSDIKGATSDIKVASRVK